MPQEPSPSPWWRIALRVGLLSFILAVMTSYLSGLALGHLPTAIAALVVLFLIVIGIAFDVLGTSVTAADKTPLNAMAAKRLHGARHALWLVKNADRVANIANDVVGDVTGAVAGAVGGAVALQFSQAFQSGPGVTEMTGLVIIGVIAALTVGGKAAGKRYAISNATAVLYSAGRILYTIERVLGRSIKRGRQKNTSRRRTP